MELSKEYLSDPGGQLKLTLGFWTSGQTLAEGRGAHQRLLIEIGLADQTRASSRSGLPTDQASSRPGGHLADQVFQHTRPSSRPEHLADQAMLRASIGDQASNKPGHLEDQTSTADQSSSRPSQKAGRSCSRPDFLRSAL